MNPSEYNRDYKGGTRSVSYTHLRIWFEPMAKDYGYEIYFIELPFSEETMFLAKGYDAACIFVNDHVNGKMIDYLYENKVKALLLRSAGYNHVDVKAAKGKIEVLRVPSYSPEAVAEFAMAMLLTVNRFTHKAYGRTREFNMNINGLMGTDLFHKVAGVIGTGKIGQAMILSLIHICLRALLASASWHRLPDSKDSCKGRIKTPVLSTTANILASCYGEIDRHNDFF